MAKVTVDFIGKKGALLGSKVIATTGDTAYIFDDIAGELLDEAGEPNMEVIPKRTAEMIIRIPCEF